MVWKITAVEIEFDASMSLASAAVHHIHEVLADASLHRGASVRVIGTLAQYDPREQRATIQHGGHALEVDTSLLGACDSFAQGRLFQFIGETETVAAPMSIGSPPPSLGVLVLRARVYQDVDGMDMALFGRALAVRRVFLAEQQQQQ
jgi:hypothetical protein